MQYHTPPSEVQTNAIQSRQNKLEKIREMGIDPFPATFKTTHNCDVLQNKYAQLADDERTDETVVVAGRIMSSRNSGMFRDIRDGSAKIQIFTHKSDASEQSLALGSVLDVGDFIGVEGKIRRTKTGELTVNATNITLLTKSLLPLPEKFHGIKDSELRQRNRSIDLISNDNARNVFRTRSRILQNLRNFMSNDGFLEIETPVLHKIYGGATAEPFLTHYNSIHEDMYLRIALELHLKRTLVGGLSDKLYEIGRVFRNEGTSTRHNPEFTMLEAYWAYADYEDVMDLVERMFESLACDINGDSKVSFANTEINFQRPFKRISMPKVVREVSGIDFMQIESDEEARNIVKGKLGIEIDSNALWGDCLEAVFSEKVEHTLIQPTHVIDYPKDISPLAKVHPDNDRLVSRFETFCNGWEVANAFNELNDPVEQRERMLEQVEAAHRSGESARELDEEFLAAIEQGMPPAGGLGIGIDRLVMLLTDSQTIRDVICRSSDLI